MNKYIKYIGCDDPDADLFEGLYRMPGGFSYNSYLIKDKKIAVMDTVDKRKTTEWMDALNKMLDGAQPDYLVVHHVEPDHSYGIKMLLEAYPSVRVVGNEKIFTMLSQFYGDIPNRVIVKDGDQLDLGDCKLNFVFAPMVHWPEVMVSYEPHTKSLFSADAFGKFGTHAADEPWDDEARRYYYNIVGKFGVQVQKLLVAAKSLDIKTIYPLHGPVLTENLSHYFDLYDKWSKWEAEEKGIVIACAGAHGNTVDACRRLEQMLKDRGQTVAFYDLSRSDSSYALADTFKYDRLVIATTTYYNEIFPAMYEFLTRLLAKGYSSRTVGIIENGTWLSQAGKKMRAMLEPLKNMNILSPMVSIKSALSPESEMQLEALADALCVKD